MLSIYLEKSEYNWKVRKVVLEHNHELAPVMMSHLILNHHKMTDAAKAYTDGMHAYGIEMSKILGYIVDEAVKKANGDANATLVYFEGKVIGDPMYVARYNHKKDERLGNMVWIDGHSRSDFQCFGDVLAFDSTYRKNKYKRPIVIFSGSNNHKQTTIFGFGLLIDEMVSSYRWMLQNIGGYVLEEVLCSCYRLRQNDDKSCEVGFTGGTHRLCTWHVEKNAMSNGKDEHLRSLFNRWLYWT
ncbi:protein FAR1-RELATED SEQUENCE 5-like [Arachis duranensis]|uniref:Protein FAR1-RELATED SEQUENCE 5-like n=1 Tax=Arachis duranensis TaxID=130453 RepID=A0A6P4DI41_ARADU|nr:protein FAR1-RELATED SEQUENCE 5-like [Arachis duranensis]